MNTEEILKGNKSICDFMGLKTKINQRGSLIITYETESEFDFEYAEYNLSWRKLMSVINKIESDLGTTVIILKNKCRITKFSEKLIPEFSKTVEAENKLDATFLCVVEYVNWYNKLG